MLHNSQIKTIDNLKNNPSEIKRLLLISLVAGDDDTTEYIMKNVLNTFDNVILSDIGASISLLIVAIKESINTLHLFKTSLKMS
jgi:hypothetical protein